MTDAGIKPHEFTGKVTGYFIQPDGKVYEPPPEVDVDAEARGWVPEPDHQGWVRVTGDYGGEKMNWEVMGKWIDASNHLRVSPPTFGSNEWNIQMGTKPPTPKQMQTLKKMSESGILNIDMGLDPEGNGTGKFVPGLNFDAAKRAIREYYGTGVQANIPKPDDSTLALRGQRLMNSFEKNPNEVLVDTPIRVDESGKYEMAKTPIYKNETDAADKLLAIRRYLKKTDPVLYGGVDEDSQFDNIYRALINPRTGDVYLTHGGLGTHWKLLTAAEGVKYTDEVSKKGWIRQPKPYISVIISDGKVSQALNPEYKGRIDVIKKAMPKMQKMMGQKLKYVGGFEDAIGDAAVSKSDVQANIPKPRTFKPAQKLPAKKIKEVSDVIESGGSVITPRKEWSGRGFLLPDGRLVDIGNNLHEKIVAKAGLKSKSKIEPEMVLAQQTGAIRLSASQPTLSQAFGKVTADFGQPPTEAQKAVLSTISRTRPIVAWASPAVGEMKTNEGSISAISNWLNKLYKGK